MTADREPVDALQATATVSVSDAATAVVELPEQTVVPAALTDVVTDDLASLKPVVSLPKVVDPEPTASTVAHAGMPINKAATADRDFPETAIVVAGVSAAEAPVLGAPLSDAPRPMRRLGSLFTSDPLKEYPQPAVRPVETPSECPAPQICIDDYLWSVYERTPKIDTNKVLERTEVTVKEKRKTRTVIKTITKYVVGDFTWKDPIAARRAGMSLKDYVIGGMDPGFKLKLYRALRAMDDAGLMPGITSAFRDDYRQSIASGNKAASDSSYHGGSRRGGYGYGLAADLVSVKGETRMQRYASSQELWKWIDAHEKELGVARPYLDRDPPHVAPIDGEEYAAKRERLIAQKAELQTKKHDRVALRSYPSPTKRAKMAKSSSVSSLQPVPRPRTQERAVQRQSQLAVVRR
jgi:hypothetical protein